MPWFRPRLANEVEGPPTLSTVRRLAAEILRPGHFFLGPDLDLCWEAGVREELSWEIFQGRLLDPAHTRTKVTFESWNLFTLAGGVKSPEPFLSVKLEEVAGKVHVVRAMECYVWEGYQAEAKVFLSREKRKWVRELVRTLSLAERGDAAEFRDELACCVFEAVVGRRLPLTSLEAPLPAFSFGQLAYCYRKSAPETPCRCLSAWVDSALSLEMMPAERARVLETILRASPNQDIAALVQHFAHGNQSELIPLFKTMFGQISLSPYTDFVARMIASLGLLEQTAYLQAGEVVDFCGYLIGLICRHLTAYDLATFHHRGANYPDALLLDTVWKEHILRAENAPQLFLDQPGEEEGNRKRLRRRAVRQGFLLRGSLEGLPVPNLPTSPGENSRVYPTGHPHLPESQLLNSASRTRALFSGDAFPASRFGPNALAVFRQSAEDLVHEIERQELGAALFLDRPFGVGKAPAEPDATLLLSSVAYSRSVAEKRLLELASALGLRPEKVEKWRRLLAMAGPGLDTIGPPVKPATLSLTDARLASADFQFLYTTEGSVRALLAQLQFAPVTGGRNMLGLFREKILVARDPASMGVHLYSVAHQWQPIVRLEVNPRGGFTTRAGQEWPRDGFAVKIL
jgi:hypothetical protein